MGKYQLTQVGKRKIKLSNLGKILFPDSEIIKAELVAYYLQMAPTILRYIKQRPLSLIRYPDGIQAHQFFQKDKPDWSPDWVESVPLGKEEKKHYILATEEASIVWLANLACIELHIRQDKFPKNDTPNFFIFDLDPPATQPFTEIVQIALYLKDFLESYGYHPFAKTSGGKGIHIFVPIEPLYDYDTMFTSVKQLAETFVKSNSADCTLKINKEARKGKLLLDIYRNRGSQTIVAPYSVRGKEPGSVSMPLGWETIKQIKDPDLFHIRNVYEIVKAEGDAWEGFSSFAVTLHTDKKDRKGAHINLPDSKFYKTPAQLKAYQDKRDFSKTPEPTGQTLVTDGSSFVVHRHHASRLHYDLRLEKEGTLISWAVPKGMPHKPGIKRLAVQTEPHPIEYLQFDGEIPKGQYGGGMMWIFARGKYEVTKEKKDGFYFHISSPQMDGEYRIHNIKDKEWLLERVDRDLINIMDDFLAPMLAENQRNIPNEDDAYLYEVKWDGIRAFIGIEEGEIIIRTRNNNIVTDQFPELKKISDSFRISNGIFDGEIVCLDQEGKPDFKKVVSRLHHNSPARIEQASKINPVFCYLFDCLYLDGRSIINEPIERRKDWLYDSVKKGGNYRISKHLDDGQALFEAAKNMQLEGIIAKRRNSKYAIGKRNKDWVKIKFRQTADCYIIGFTQGKGDRIALFGALHIAEINNSEIIYRGKVGTGFDELKMKRILKKLNQVEVTNTPIPDKVPDAAVTTWIHPELVCEIEYASITSNQTFREPVFVKIKSTSPV